MKRNTKTISNTFPHYRSQQVSLLALDLVSIMQRNCRGVNLAKNRNRTKMALDEKMALNGKSLSWTGLTREWWCCTVGLVSRLDMIMCQTSINTDILLEHC